MEKCVICGCVRNCEQYIEKVFENISKIQTIFKQSKIIMSFDNSTDGSLEKLRQLKTKFDMEIIINRNPITNNRTVDIERARNKILDLIYNKYSLFDYFIMIDMDDVCSKPIYIESLINGLNNKNKWDGLFFNNKNYYDFWALSFDDFEFSCWHSNNNRKLINLMNEALKGKFNEEFVECLSAFGGFGIYKIDKFIGCKYRSLIDLYLFDINKINLVNEKYNIKYVLNKDIYDCEHRYFHLNAIKKNKVTLRICKDYLFPPYIGVHTNVLD